MRDLERKLMQNNNFIPIIIVSQSLEATIVAAKTPQTKTMIHPPV